MFHPLAAASADRNNALFALIIFISCVNKVSFLIIAVLEFNIFNRCIKVEINLVFKVIIKIFKHNVVDIRTEMTD